MASIQCPGCSVCVVSVEKDTLLDKTVDMTDLYPLMAATEAWSPWHYKGNRSNCWCLFSTE